MTRPRLFPALILLLPVLTLAASLLIATPAFSFLPQLTSSQPDHWNLTSPTAFPMWDLNPSTSGAHISGSQSVAQVMQASFGTWTGAPNTAASVLRGPDSSVTQKKNSPSNINLICFVCSDAPFGGTETLAVTVTTTANGARAADRHRGPTQISRPNINSDNSFHSTTRNYNS